MFAHVLCHVLLSVVLASAGGQNAEHTLIRKARLPRRTLKSTLLRKEASQTHVEASVIHRGHPLLAVEVQPTIVKDLSRASSQSQRDQLCERRKRWFANAPANVSDGTNHPLQSFFKKCARIQNVCLNHDSSLVIMSEHNMTTSPKDILHKYVQGDIDFKQILNLPGYHDSMPEAQYQWPTSRIRPASDLDPPEMKSGWSRHTSHVPVLYFPQWFNNIGENIATGALLALAVHLVDLPKKDQSLIIGAPQSMLMPRHWKLLDRLVYSVRGLSESCLHCDDQPAPCFDHMFVCGPDSFPPNDAYRFDFLRGAGLKAVGQALTSMVGASCDSNRKIVSQTDNVFRVWFDERRKDRRILNLDELVMECSRWVPAGFIRSECHRKAISSSFDAACELNGYNALVGIHGAGIANGLFVKKASGAIIEVTTHGWGPPGGPAWGGTLYHKLFRNTPVRYFWYDAPLNDTTPGEIENCHVQGKCKQQGIPLRDRNIKVHWLDHKHATVSGELVRNGQGGLKSILEAVAANGPDAHRRSTHDIMALL
eukprot:TRINITY_DN75001_c0_g1_i1.p1 TRINITY_DN75001_c0_g1~~TRINITY_DN75001_c0_g1_i1.p1  ORF type:complete len:546 (+),score=49.09 TRINITY_DN75001_c0_g1_i1:25-1638(+)